MASDELNLALRADISAMTSAEGIGSHGIIQLGINLAAKPLVFSRTLKIIHEKSFPPHLNLALEPGGPAPAWCPTLTIAPIGSPVPPPPGPVGTGPTPIPGIFKPGLHPVIGIAPTMPEAPLVDVAGATTPAIGLGAVVSCPAGGFAFFSAPNSVHLVQVQGTVVPYAPGDYSYAFYVSACPYVGPMIPPTGRYRIGKVYVTVSIQ